MVGRILRTADFERVLALPPRSRSAHFAAHHLPAAPSAPKKPVKASVADELSTGDAPSCPPPVEDLPLEPPAGCWLGMVVPKRHARRAVTRTLLKRQMRAVMQAHGPGLPPGLWVLRLKAPFDRSQFHSAASDALRVAARAELAVLLQRALQPAPAGRPARPSGPARRGPTQPAAA
ncbi:ribonuclease P protein component [Aquabacterium sp. OR-4]|uniref:ribonuclease P protein component n=1 Tax=Aquabacterium sp. OR-4 TaxID=2978127 RepID=UPI0028CA3507|nr:ribonuclease P protein component [Aquabacterium sp. OR-4]MDT7833758.1 ribonuclease P protein component [Aquabacterium sp. OR-4]